MIFELLIISALCIAGYYFLFHKKSGAIPPISLKTSQDNDTIVKKSTLDQKNTQEMVVGLTDNMTQKEIASPETKTVPPAVIPTQEEFQQVKDDFSQKEMSQDRLPSFVGNSNIQKEDLTEIREFVPTEVEQLVFDKEIIDKQETVFEENDREEQRTLVQETEIFENKAVEEKEIRPDVQIDENIMREYQEEAIYQKPQEEYNVDVQKELTRVEEELTIPKEIKVLPEDQQETPKHIEETHQEFEKKPEIVEEVADVEKPEIEAETFEQEYEAEKEKTEQVVNPFVDEQVTTDEKPIFEDIQQEDTLNKEAEELPTVVENVEENLSVPKDQKIAADIEKPEIEAETYEQEYEAEKEKAEEVVNPFVDEQVPTDEKPIFEDIQQEDILKKEVLEPVVENIEENLFAPKDQEIAVESQEEEKPQIELAEVSAPIEESTKLEELKNQEEEIQQHIPELIEMPQDQEIKTVELIEEEAVKPIQEEEYLVVEDIKIEENPFVHNQVEEIITQEEEKPLIETPIISELQQKPLDDAEVLKVENREEFLAKEAEPVSEPVHAEEAHKETVQEDLAETKDQEIQSSAKKATRKGFNFRTNKTKIESIMPKLETPEKQNISDFNKTTEVIPTPLTFEEKEERIVEDLINELGTPIQLIKYQSSEIETPFTIYEQEKIEPQPEPEQPVEKTTVKRGFNFRTKKNKIESILHEGSEKSSSGEILKESLIEEPQVQKEAEPFIKEIETIQVPETEENVSKEIEPVSEPVKTDKAPTKRGFNFRANKNKIESLEKSLSQEDTKETETELLEEKKPLEILPVEEKPISNEAAVIQPTQEEPQVSNDKVSSKRGGFNFRTKKNKIEAMLTPSVETPEKKLVEGSEKSSSGEFQSMQQEVPEEVEQNVLPETSPIKIVESLPAADQETLEEKAQFAGKTMGAKRSFNFRANKRKIDSILKKDSSGHLDLSAENENSLSNILESTVNTSMTHSTEDVLGPREENMISIGEEAIEPQTKRKGFNFRNTKKKTVIESPQKQDENSIVSGITEESPQKSENVLNESGKGEVKKLKGFNFRNPNRVKAE